MEARKECQTDVLRVSYEEFKVKTRMYTRLAMEGQRVLVEENGVVVMSIGVPPLEFSPRQGAMV